MSNITDRILLDALCVHLNNGIIMIIESKGRQEITYLEKEDKILNKEEQ